MSDGFFKTKQPLSVAYEKAYVMRFLMGLNENFKTVKSQILMFEPFPSISKVYALVLQEESHKNIGHGSTFTPRPDSVAMYVLTATCLGTLWRSATNAMGIHLDTSTKASPMSNASIQCPISKAQCEQLLALFNTGADLGDSHHAAFVSTSGGVSSLTSGASSVSATVGVASTSTSPLANVNSNFIDTMSGIIPSLSFTTTLKHSIFSAKIVNREVFHTTN